MRVDELVRSDEGTLGPPEHSRVGINFYTVELNRKPIMVS